MGKRVSNDSCCKQLINRGDDRLTLCVIAGFGSFASVLFGAALGFCGARHSAPARLNLLAVPHRHHRRLPPPRLHRGRQINVERQHILRRPTLIEWPRGTRGPLIFASKSDGRICR
jgi:hypothetical protein